MNTFTSCTEAIYLKTKNTVYVYLSSGVLKIVVQRHSRLTAFPCPPVSHDHNFFLLQQPSPDCMIQSDERTTSPYRVAPSHQHNAASSATVRVLSRLHSSALRSLCCSVVRFCCDLETCHLLTATTIFGTRQANTFYLKEQHMPKFLTRMS
jgi:hypothetical protein